MVFSGVGIMAHGKPCEMTSPRTGLGYWAQRVLAESDKAGKHFDPDSVHDLRVALRRCRSMADGFVLIDPDPGWRRLKKLGKALFSRLGELRDVQVMVEWVSRLGEPEDPIRKGLLDSFATKEQQLKKDAHEALLGFDCKEWASLAQELARHTEKVPPEGVVFQQLAVERWQDAYYLHRRALRNRSQVAFHLLRIGLKKFRYTVENFLPHRHATWGKDLRELQDLLGEVHDLDVLWAILRGRRNLGANSACTGRPRSGKNGNNGWQNTATGWLGHTPCGENGAPNCRRRKGWRARAWPDFARGRRSSIRTLRTRRSSPIWPCSSTTGWFETGFLGLAITVGASSKRRLCCTMLGLDVQNKDITRSPAD
jgi:CHAD domain-containing protein